MQFSMSRGGGSPRRPSPCSLGGIISIMPRLRRWVRCTTISASRSGPSIPSSSKPTTSSCSRIHDRRQTPCRPSRLSPSTAVNLPSGPWRPLGGTRTSGKPISNASTGTFWPVSSIPCSTANRPRHSATTCWGTLSSLNCQPPPAPLGPGGPGCSLLSRHRRDARAVRRSPHPSCRQIAPCPSSVPA